MLGLKFGIGFETGGWFPHLGGILGLVEIETIGVLSEALNHECLASSLYSKSSKREYLNTRILLQPTKTTFAHDK